MNRLYFLLLLPLMTAGLPLVAVSQDARDERPTPAVSRVDELEPALHGVASNVDRSGGGTDGTQAVNKTQVIWLLDYTNLVRKHDLLSRLSSGMREAFEIEDGTFVHTRHTIILMNRELQLLVQSASSPSKVESTLQSVYQNDPTNQVKNTFQKIQRVVRGFHKLPGKKLLVLFSLINGDTEYRTEETVHLLRQSDISFYAISREAIMSDSFWFRKDEKKKNKDLYYGGPESPHYEYPWGWLMQRSEVTDLVPSGFGIYGLQRLANATGGRYYVYFPEQFNSPFCQSVDCALCNGSHLVCIRPYKFNVVERFAPWVGSRGKYRQILARSRLTRTYFSIWADAYKAGFVRTGPPLKPGKTEKYIREWKKWRQYDFLHGGGLKKLLKQAKLAREKIKEVSQLIRRLQGVQNNRAEEYPLPRIAAFANLMELSFRMTRFNLQQFVRFAGFIQEIHNLQQVPPNLLFLLPISPGGEGKLIYRGKFYYYGHGPERMKPVHFLGGENVKRELEQLNKHVKEHLREFRGTPWGLAVRRLGLVRYSAWYRQITSGGGGGKEKKRTYPMSEEGSAATETGGGGARPGGQPGSKGSGSVQTGK